MPDIKESEQAVQKKILDALLNNDPVSARNFARLRADQKISFTQAYLNVEGQRKVPTAKFTVNAHNPKKDAPVSLVPPELPLSRLSRMTDLIPMPGLRKRLRKFNADQVAEIAELEKQGRLQGAKWMRLATWGLWFWYVLQSPITSLIQVVRKSQ